MRGKPLDAVIIRCKAAHITELAVLVVKLGYTKKGGLPQLPGRVYTGFGYVEPKSLERHRPRKEGRERA